MNYTIIKNALTDQQCDDYLALGESLYLQTNQYQKIGVRNYFGFTLPPDGEELLVLGSLAQNLGFQFDYSPGTGINYINAQPGEQLGPHYDMPLPLVDGRICVVSVLAALTSNYTGGTVSIEDAEVRLEKGDALVINGGTLHQLNPIETGTLNMLAAFFCTNGN